MAAIHLNMMPLKRDAAMFDHPSEAEACYVLQMQAWLREETGYQAIQGTRPQTLAYALSDSPLGLAAWIAEKFSTGLLESAPAAPAAAGRDGWRKSRARRW